MTKYNEALIWSAIHSEIHPTLSGREKTIEGYMPLVSKLFPGIDYYSISGFNQVMQNYVRPTLSKLFPNLVEKSVETVNRNKTVNVNSFLPSKGYEHLDNPKWKKKLEALLK